MFFCVKESELDRLSEFTTRNIAAYALDKSYDRHTNSSGICYEYLADLFPTTDEVNAALQANKPKKAMLKLAKSYIKKLYNPKDDPIAYRFNLAVLALLHVANKRSRNIIVFVEPDNVPAQYASYFKYIKVYLNAIIAEFYAEGYVKRKGKKVLPTMLFEHFVPNWLRLGKKDTKKLCKYFKKAGYGMGKEHAKKLKRKQIAKSVACVARSSELSASGQNLYDMIDLTFNVDFGTSFLCSCNYQGVKKDARKRLGTILANKLCLRGDKLIDDLAKNCSTKDGKKTIKKLRKRINKRSKEQIKYYKELITIFGTGDDTGASLNDMAQRKIVKLPKVGKKCAKSNKKYQKVVKAFASMKAPSIGIIYTHITARCMGAEIGDGEYNRMMSNVIAQLDPSKYHEPKQLAKQFVNLAKAYKKAAAAAQD